MQARGDNESLPIAFFIFHCWHTQEFIDSFIRIIPLHLLGVVVFVLYADIASLLVVTVFVFEVVPVLDK